MRIGAHMSVAGGLTRAVDRAVRHGCEALQIFTKNNARWEGRSTTPEEANAFRAAVEAAGLTPVVAHASYLINLAAPAGPLRERSITAMLDELERADALGLDGVVLHPGVASEGSTETEALALVADAISAVLSERSDRPTKILLEHTAGQGRSLGHRFEQLAVIFDRLNSDRRLGVCLDTCHLLASGYDIASSTGYDDTFDAFERLIGIDRLKIFHANDSKRHCGSRIDRHEHVGQGCVGLPAFARLLADQRFVHLAMVLETAKTPGICDNPRRTELDPLDAMNLETLRALRRGPAAL